MRLSTVQRKNHDFEVLYKQQKRLQAISDYKSVNIVKAMRRIDDKFYSNTSLIFLHASNPFRKFLIRIVLTKQFDWAVLVVIIANCAVITIPEFTDITWQDTADIVFLWIYTIESCLKIICMGFMMGKYSYLRDPWNVLDFIVLLTGWAGILFKSGSINLVRTIRILRPLRTFNSVPEMKTLIVSIFRALPLLLDIFLLFLFSLFVFALIGVQIYAGQLDRRCIVLSSHEITDKLCNLPKNCAKFDTTCSDTGCNEDEYCWHTGLNPNQDCTSFDNILLSMLTVFIAVTLEGWSDVMRYGRKVLNQKFLNDIYFILLIIIISFFLIKLTVAAIYVKFMQTREEEEKIRMEASIWDVGPDEPFVSQTTFEYKWYLVRDWAYRVVKDSKFDRFFAVVIAVNTCVMASEYYGMDQLHFDLINYCNSILTLLFTFELVLKLMGLGARNYLNSIGNIFDALLVMIGIIEIVNLAQQRSVSQQKVLRVVRVLRVFKLARTWQDLKVILEKLINSTKSILYLGLITFITIFIYSLLGKRLFEGKLDDGLGGVPRANFNNFWWAFVTVFNLLTGENWNSIFYNTVGPMGWIYSIYFISLIVIGGYILLNLFIAILLEQFEEKPGKDSEIDKIDLESTILYRYRQVTRLESKKKDIKRRAKIKLKFTEVSSNNQDLRIEGSSYCLFKSSNKFRILLKSIMIHPYFDSLVYSLIIMSCASLVLDEPEKSAFTGRFLNIYNRVSLSLFICEFLIKSIVLGFIFGKNSYIKSTWNIIDLSIICFSLLDEILSVSLKSLNFVRAFRALRALRPLRMVSHNENMRKVISSIFAAIPAVINVMLITLLFYIVFGIIGVIFFKGIMYSCNDSLIELQDDCKGTFVVDGMSLHREWIGSPYNFDNIGNAMLTLFSISTLEAWPSYMYAAVDGVEPGHAQKRDANQFAAIFYITFIFITNFFIMNLYLGAVIKKFNEIQEEIDGSFFLSSSQKEWVRTQKLMINCSPKIRYLVPDNSIRRFFFRMVMDYKFEYVIQSIITLNVIFMAMFTYPSDESLLNFQYISNIVFISIFILEFLAKITGVGIRFYFASRSNKFDFLILILSLASMSNYLNFSNALVLRALRISRLLRIMKIFKSFQSLIKTLVVSLPSLLNVGAILCLLWFVYGIAGIYLFSDLDYSNASVLNDDINFKTFYNSIMVLFQSITGENWNLIMIDCMGHNCKGENCGSPISATIFWISYTILGQYFFLSLFIAVILENFTSCGSEVTMHGIHHNDLKKFQQVWSIYSPYGENYIDTKYVPSFLQYLDPPLGFNGQNLSRSKILHIVLALGVSDVKGKVHFAELLWKLAHAVSGTDMSTAAPCEALRNIQKILPRKLHFVQRLDPTTSLAAKTLAAYVIIDKWRRYKKSKTIQGDVGKGVKDGKVKKVKRGCSDN